MPRNFKLPSLPPRALNVAAVNLAALKDPQIRVRVLLGILLSANLVAAVFAFHLFDESPEQTARQVLDTRQQILQQLKKLNSARQLASKVEKGREQGTQFIDTYMTSRRVTYSSVINELYAKAAESSVRPKDSSFSIDAIPGTDSLDMMTITASFEGGYKSLLLFVNGLDKSKRFMIIESLAAAPQSNGLLQITLKLNTFAKEDSSSL